MSIRRAISLLCALLCLGVLSAYGQSVKEKESRKARLEKEIAILDRQIRDNAARNADALARLSLIRSKIATRQALVDESDRELAVLEDSIAVRQQQLDQLQARLDTMVAYSSRLVKSAYKNRDSRIWYMYILASENVAQGFRRMSFFKNISAQMTVQAAKIKESKAAVEQEKAAMELLAADARKIKERRLSDVRALQAEEKEAQTLSANLNRQKARYQKELVAKRRQADALEREPNCIASASPTRR